MPESELDIKGDESEVPAGGAVDAVNSEEPTPAEAAEIDADFAAMAKLLGGCAEIFNSDRFNAKVEKLITTLEGKSK